MAIINLPLTAGTNVLRRWWLRKQL